MHNFFIYILILFMLVYLVIGIVDRNKVKSFTDFVNAGRKQSTAAVTMTLLATVIGASATIGIADTVNSIGFPGIWWLVFGAVGLVLQSFILSEKIRRSGAVTLPDLINITAGRTAEVITSLAIVIAWPGIIAGQLVAINSIITLATGRSSTTLFIAVSLVVIIYTIIGGQMSVVRTDRVQLIIILAGIAFTFVWLYCFEPGDTASVFDNVELLNENYGPADLFTQLFVIGGVYFLGPDIISRNFISENEKTAKRSALYSGIGVFLFSIVITLTGMWVRYNVSPDELGDTQALMYVIGIMPKAMAAVLIFGLLSALISSTDTCLINASTIFVKDILNKDRVAYVRITAALIGAISMFLALSNRGDIMGLLTGAYSIYTPGVVFPLFVAVMAHGKREIRKKVWVAAVIAGGSFGIASTYFGEALSGIGVPDAVMSYMTLIGMALSLIISLASVLKK